MDSPETPVADDFQPGFRLSVRDVVVILLGVAAASYLTIIEPWWGFIVAFVVAHFFLFCNVVRMARPLELTWTAVFLALASATLMIGANFPDIDVIAVPFGEHLTWRRGITHGFLALAILPFVLAWLMQLYDRRVRLRRTPDAPPADFRQLVILSAIGIITHPTLDFMNTYGVRWLMPFVDKWFYADGLFIIDLWLWIALMACVVWSRRAKRPGPARGALVFLAAYMVVNLGLTGLGRREVASRYPGTRYVVGPLPVRSWGRNVVVDDGQTYRFGTYVPGRGLQMSTSTLHIGADNPAPVSSLSRRRGARLLDRGERMDRA